jgi:hypothetical protein
MTDHRRRKDHRSFLRRLDDVGRKIEAAAWMILWAAVGASIMTLVMKWISVGIH